MAISVAVTDKDCGSVFREDEVRGAGHLMVVKPETKSHLVCLATNPVLFQRPFDNDQTRRSRDTPILSKKAVGFIGESGTYSPRDIRGNMVTLGNRVTAVRSSGERSSYSRAFERENRAEAPDGRASRKLSRLRVTFRAQELAD
jgi:hypothetical protein